MYLVRSVTNASMSILETSRSRAVLAVCSYPNVEKSYSNANRCDQDQTWTANSSSQSTAKQGLGSSLFTYVYFCQPHITDVQ
jgi:hypothetical protein